jgi:hypothetical protein
MIYSNKSELMQGIDGLGLAPDPGILAMASSPSPSSNSGIPWSCSSFGLFCNTPSVQNSLDTSAFGGSLTQPNQVAATQAAASVIANDPSLQFDPSLANLVNPLTNAAGINWVMIAAIFGGALLLFKR